MIGPRRSPSSKVRVGATQAPARRRHVPPEFVARPAMADNRSEMVWAGVCSEEKKPFAVKRGSAFLVNVWVPDPVVVRLI